MPPALAAPPDPAGGFFFHGNGITRPAITEPSIAVPDQTTGLPTISEAAKRAYRILFQNKPFYTAPPPRPANTIVQLPQTNAVPAQQQRQPQPPHPTGAPPRIPPQQMPVMAQAPTRAVPLQTPILNHMELVQQQGPPALTAPQPAGPVCSHGVPYTSCRNRAAHLEDIKRQLADTVERAMDLEGDEATSMLAKGRELRALKKMLEEMPSSTALPQQAQQGPPPPVWNNSMQGGPDNNLPMQNTWNGGQPQGPPPPVMPQQQFPGTNGASMGPYQQSWTGPPQGSTMQPRQQQQPYPPQQPYINAGPPPGPSFGAGAYNGSGSGFGGPPPTGPGGSGFYPQAAPAMDAFGGPGEFINTAVMGDPAMQYRPDHAAMAAQQRDVFDASNDPHWRKRNFPWSKDMEDTSRVQFGIDRFQSSWSSLLL